MIEVQEVATHIVAKVENCVNVELHKHHIHEKKTLKVCIIRVKGAPRVLK